MAMFCAIFLLRKAATFCRHIFQEYRDCLCSSFRIEMLAEEYRTAGSASYSINSKAEFKQQNNQMQSTGARGGLTILKKQQTATSAHSQVAA